MINMRTNTLLLASLSALTLAGMPVHVQAGWNLEGFVDFNGDGKTDLFWIGDTAGETSGWLMNGDRVSQYTFYSPVPPQSGWDLKAVGDFNGDHKTDLFWHNTITGETSAWLMNGDRVAQYTFYAVMPPGLGWELKGVGDFNGDGKTDLFWYNELTGGISAWLMNGDRVSQYAVYPSVLPAWGWKLKGFGDFNGDGKTDLFWYNVITGETSAWILNGDRVAQYTSYSIVPPGSGWDLKGFGDFNGDHKTDVFWYNVVTGSTSAWLMNGDRVSQYTSYGIVPPGSGWDLKGFGDFNGDGKTDLFWYNRIGGSTSAWLMNGDRVAAYPFYSVVPPGSGWVLKGFGDFDGNGKTDLFWYNTIGGETSAWLMDGDRVAKFPYYSVVPPTPPIH